MKSDRIKKFFKLDTSTENVLLATRSNKSMNSRKPSGTIVAGAILETEM